MLQHLENKTGGANGMQRIDTNDIRLLNVVKINGNPYKITYISCIGDVVLSFKAVNLNNKSDCIKMVKATN